MLLIQAWTPKHKKFYKWLFNYLKTLDEYNDINIDNYIEKNKQHIINDILNNNK
jgi:hypothetical protein